MLILSIRFTSSKTWIFFFLLLSFLFFIFYLHTEAKCHEYSTRFFFFFYSSRASHTCTCGISFYILIECIMLTILPFFLDLFLFFNIFFNNILTTSSPSVSTLSQKVFVDYSTVRFLTSPLMYINLTIH